MPVYEFYCADCHTIFNFISRRVNTEKRPECPKCGRPDLERQVSLFAYSTGKSEEPAEEMPDFDESKIEKALQALSGEVGGIDENDPREMARFMRKFTEAAGVGLTGNMEEAISRLESGEDPEKIEEEMGSALEDFNPFSKESVKGLKRKYIPPHHDDTLYTL